MPRPLSLLALLTILALPAVVRADARSETAAAELLRARLKNEDPNGVALLGAVSNKDIVVVDGSMDHIQVVLTAAHIRYSLIQPNDVEAYPFHSSQIVMVNCPGYMPPGGIARLERFVRAGGLLYTTDWALLNVVQKAFPGTIAYNGGSSASEVVKVQIDSPDDNLMSRMLLQKKSQPQWWLEGGSYPIRILDPKRVQVLAHSDEMQKKYGATPIVVRFRWHDGEVIHVMSHFVRQMAAKGPAMASAAAVGEIDGLTADDKKAFAQSAGASAPIADVESSYAFQRMTANLVVGKQERNKDLDKQYNMTVAVAQPLAPTPAAAPPRAASEQLTPGIKARVLETKAGRAHVRDEMGNEGWVEEKAMIAR